MSVNSLPSESWRCTNIYTQMMRRTPQGQPASWGPTLADWQAHKSSETEQPGQRKGTAHSPVLGVTFQGRALRDPHSEGGQPREGPTLRPCRLSCSR